MNKSRFIYLAALLMVAFQVIQCSSPAGNREGGGNTEDVPVGSTNGSADGTVYVAPDTDIFVGPGVIDAWVNKFDDAAIEAHAWTLWGGITAMTDQKYPN